MILVPNCSHSTLSSYSLRTIETQRDTYLFAPIVKTIPKSFFHLQSSFCMGISTIRSWIDWFNLYDMCYFFGTILVHISSPNQVTLKLILYILMFLCSQQEGPLPIFSVVRVGITIPQLQCLQLSSIYRNSLNLTMTVKE